ncbi:DUF6620 family protein [Ornithobacterium rhinotracheale]|uniref:DUF6620 family protein n=1 Tax=Ornithobacterium rhinotracheale TaxID=28251 RepID=UPI003FA475BE
MSNENFQGGWNEEEGVYYAKGSFDNEVEYYNEIICNTNFWDIYMGEILNNMYAGNHEEPLKILEEVKEVISDNRENIQNLGDYHGDNDLMNAALRYVEKSAQQALVWEQLFKDPQANETIQEATNKLFASMQEDLTQMQTALAEFADKYFEEEEDEDYDDYDYGNESVMMQHVEFDENNPLLQPIHGISLEDYAAAAAKMASGATEDEVAKALGVERPQWDEANQLWQTRMQQDSDFTLIGLYGQYFATASSHPKFQNMESDSSTPANPENLARINEDVDFYAELAGAMQAAYEYGIDGAQWLRENYGLSIGDFQSVAMKWATSPAFTTGVIGKQHKFAEEYGKKFAEEQGGNIADDIDF